MLIAATRWPMPDYAYADAAAYCRRLPPHCHAHAMICCWLDAAADVDADFRLFALPAAAR